MPKTFTDDIAPALPSSIDGPFQVVDPTDPTSWINIDPANRQIASAGNARPTRFFSLGYVRTHLNTGVATYGFGLPGRFVSSNANGGLFVEPRRVPEDMDVSQPSKVTIVIAPLNDSSTTGEVVRLRLAWTRVTPGGGQTTGTMDNDWNVPDNWLVAQPKPFTFDNGNGRTFDANFFTQGDIIGLRYTREGLVSQDTFSQALILFEQLTFEYTAKEY